VARARELRRERRDWGTKLDLSCARPCLNMPVTRLAFSLGCENLLASDGGRKSLLSCERMRTGRTLARERACLIRMRARDESGVRQDMRSLSTVRGSTAQRAASWFVLVTLASILLLHTPRTTAALGLQNGKLPECQADHNCVSSTSIRNPSKFSPPWTYLSQTSKSSVAWAALLEELKSRPDATVVTATDRYIHATFPGRPKGIDDVEFLLLPNDDLVAYKSNSREVIYIYPLTQPIGDFGTNKNRYVEPKSTVPTTITSAPSTTDSSCLKCCCAAGLNRFVPSLAGLSLKVISNGL